MALNIENAGIFVPTTEVIDVSGIEDEKLRQILINFINTLNEMSNAINAKVTGVYSLEEFVNSKTFYPDPALSSLTAKAPTPRPVLSKVIDPGALLNGATKAVAHGITVTANTTFTKIRGTASDPVALIGIALPFVDVSATIAAGNIELSVNNTNVLITTTGNGTNFTKNKIFLEYLQE